MFSVLLHFPIVRQKMRKCPTPDDFVITPVGYFGPSRAGVPLFKNVLCINSLFSVLLHFPIVHQKMRKCPTPDDFVITPVGYFGPSRAGVPLFKNVLYINSLFSVLLHFPIVRQKMRKAAQIYKFFMTIPILLVLFHIHIRPSGEILRTTNFRLCSVLVLLLAVQVMSALSD